MQTLAYITTLFEYDSWASARIFDTVARLDSEAAALLTALGHSPGDLDMILFFRTRASSSAA